MSIVSTSSKNKFLLIHGTIIEHDVLWIYPINHNNYSVPYKSLQKKLLLIRLSSVRSWFLEGKLCAPEFWRLFRWSSVVRRWVDSDASLCCPCSGWKWLRWGEGMWRWMDISLCCPNSWNLVKLRRRYVSMDRYCYQPIVSKQLVGRIGFAANLWWPNSWNSVKLRRRYVYMDGAYNAPER